MLGALGHQTAQEQECLPRPLAPSPQAIIVRTDAARDALPDALRAGIVLTVVEAKGLEFDDVLLWNFFADSWAVEEWRGLVGLPAGGSAAAAEATAAALRLPAARPLRGGFSVDTHRALEGELKELYVALTRARTGVLIYDARPPPGSPAASASPCDWPRNIALGFASAHVAPATPGDLAAFPAASGPEEWAAQGRAFADAGRWELAVKCFTRAGLPSEVVRVRAALAEAEGRLADAAALLLGSGEQRFARDAARLLRAGGWPDLASRL